MILHLHTPVGVIQICWIAPGPSISAMVMVSLGLMTIKGFTFQVWPRSRAAQDALFSLRVLGRAGLAIPPLPFSPVMFSGDMERDSAFESLERFPRLVLRPSKDEVWANAPSDIMTPMKIVVILFIFFEILRFWIMMKTSMLKLL